MMGLPLAGKRGGESIIVYFFFILSLKILIKSIWTPRVQFENK